MRAHDGCYLPSSLCNGHGTWDESNQSCKCNNHYIGENCNACETGWDINRQCQYCAKGYTLRYGECQLTSGLCEHGTWQEEDGSCKCDDKWKGEFCDECSDDYATESSQCKECISGYVHYNNQCTNARQVCNNHGTWIEGSSACLCDFGWNPTGGCSACLTGYNGSNCETCGSGYVNPAKGQQSIESACSGCFLEGEACKNDGKWSKETQSCQCKSGWTGSCCTTFTGPAAAAARISGEDIDLSEVEVNGDEVTRALEMVRKISLVQQEEADAYGVKASGNVKDGKGLYLIDVQNNSQTGDAYGIDAKSVNLTKGVGEIKVKGNADVYGIKASEDVSNGWNINAQGQKEAYGIYADKETSGKGKLNNKGDIYVSGNKAKTLTGIYAKNYEVENTGNITVEGGLGTTSYGIYANNSDIINSGEITVEGNKESYGIYGTNHSTIQNTGKITLNGEACEGENCSSGRQIGLDDTSVLKNNGKIQSQRELDFNQIGGNVVLGKGGSFEAKSLKGRLNVDAEVVSGGFKDEYVEKDALKGEDKGLEIKSNSAMFRASSQENENGNADVVMKRENFETISQSNSIASYLEENYRQEKNEKLFEKLKLAPTNDAYEKAEAELTGTQLIPNFSQENMRLLRNLNATLTEELMNAEGKDHKIVGYDYQYSKRGDKGTLTGYENYANSMYFMYDKELENMFSAGLGMSITQFRSDYEDDSTRHEMLVQILTPFGRQIGKNWRWQSIGRFGYADGEYERHTSYGTYESDLTGWIYGLSNALRYTQDMGFVIIEPEVQFNVLGYYQNRIREDANKDLSISADSSNNISVESGFGVFIKKNMVINEFNRLKMKLGGMWYHEFANPYHSLRARHRGSVGSYRLTDKEGIYNRNRGVLRADIEYDWHSLTFYLIYRHYLEDEDPMSVNAGVKYKF